MYTGFQWGNLKERELLHGQIAWTRCVCLSCERRDQFSGSINSGEFLHQLCIYQLLEMCSVESYGTMRTVLNGPWAQRNTVLSGKRLQSRGSKLKVTILNGTFQQRKKFLSFAVPYRQVLPYCIMILTRKTVIPEAKRVILIVLKCVGRKRSVFLAFLGIRP